MVGFPLLLIPLAIYNIIVFLMPTVSFADPLVKLTLMSGAVWAVTLSDILLALGILMLMFEVIKGARPGAKYLTDHLLSVIVFGAAAAEFLLWSKFGTSTYFLLTLLALVDVLSGIALRARRGTLAAPAGAVAGRAARRPAAVPEPEFDPAPAPEAAPLDHAEPKFGHPEAAPGGRSSDVPSPGLQPGDGVPPSSQTPQR